MFWAGYLWVLSYVVLFFYHFEGRKWPGGKWAVYGRDVLYSYVENPVIEARRTNSIKRPIALVLRPDIL